MDLAIWDALLEIISWSIRLLFWPLGLVIRHREFLSTILPYLVVGIVNLVIGLGVLASIGCVMRSAGNMFRIFGLANEAVKQRYGASERDAEEYKAMVKDSPNDPYEVLGLQRDITQSELAARYRELLQANHPDRVAQLDPAIQALATQRSRRIIEAYKKLRIHDLPASG